MSIAFFLALRDTHRWQKEEVGHLSFTGTTLCFEQWSLCSIQLLEYGRISKMTAEQLRLPLSSPLDAKAARALLKIYTLHTTELS